MKRLGLTVVLAAFAAAPAAGATFTPVNPRGAGTGNERCLAGTTCPDGGAYAGNASILEIIRVDIAPSATLERVDDGLDQLWLNFYNGATPLGAVQARARYAGDNSDLGYDASGVYTKLLDVLGNSRVSVDHAATAASFAGQSKAGDIVVSGGAGDWVTIGALSGTPFPFVLHNLSAGYYLSSATGAGCPAYAVNCNVTGVSPWADWMVTWQVTSSAFPHYVIAWEDRNNTGLFNDNFGFSARPNDWDYNDYVFELRYVAPVPEPALMVLFGAGLIGAAMRLRRR